MLCAECKALSDSDAATVRPFRKPCAQFDIYTTWKPRPFRVVFIAEAPPANSDGYFYDSKPHANYKETLRKALFELLELKGDDTSARLFEFKKRGYFLVDAIKCRCKKTNGQPLASVTRTCAGKWLAQELEEVGSPSRICVFGLAARLALSQVKGFEELSRYSVTRDCGEVIKAERGEVLIWPFLGWRNEEYYLPKIPMFKRFCCVN